MDIIVSNMDSTPIYEQITRQIKAKILGGELQPGEALPSMRLLAKELRISVITTKRAYEELEREGLITSQTGRGSFVAPVSSERLREAQLRTLKTIAAAAKEFAGGNFDVRVPEDNRCYEIDELAVSFNNMARDLDQLEELTRGFISNVSHEFKTPMTTIGGFVDGMIDGTIPLDQRDKYLKIIAEETKRLSRMVNRMLDAAKIQSGELILSPAPFDFTEMTAQILLSFEQKIEKKKLDVQCDLEERLTVMGDRDHLYRVVYNLTDNAVKFIEDGGTLRLKVHQEGQLCVFAISNTGIGISAEDLPHVFDRFYKTDRSRSMDKTGAGLGLYIVKNIINLHGGEISVRSGGGETEFEFTLPLAPEQNRQNNA